MEYVEVARMGSRERSGRDALEAIRRFVPTTKVLYGLIMSAVVFSLGSAASAAAVETGKITGTVTSASNGDPIKGIEVCAYPESGEGSPEDIGCANTGSNGEYAITGLASGEYVVEFSSGSSGELNYVTQYYNGKSSPAEATPVRVAAPETTLSIDAKLNEGGRIAGRVTDASTNGALENIAVVAFEGGGRSSAVSFGVTNPGGEYTIAGLPAGEYKVAFIGGSGAGRESAARYHTQYYNDKSSLAEANVVTVTVGQATGGIDAALQPVVVLAPPVDITPPTVSGPLAVGSLLACSNGLWTGNPAPAFTYAWLRDGVPIAGATESAYKVQSADEGAGLSCEVTAQNTVARKSATSAAAAIPGPPHGPTNPKPRVAVTSPKIAVSGSSASVHIRCGEAECRGSIELTVEIVGRESKGGRKVKRSTTLVLAEGSFSLATGKSAIVRLRLTAAGKRRLGHVGRRAIAAEIRVSVRGGATVVESVSVDAGRDGGRRAREAIVGGTQISIAQAPWQVEVQAVYPISESEAERVRCGGSILDATQILTAAHCAFESASRERIPAGDFTVEAGTSNIASPEGEPRSVAAASVRVHPYYTYEPGSGRTSPDDVAVLTLAEPLALGPSASPIPLVAPEIYPQPGAAVGFTGFGVQNPSTEELNGNLYSLGMTVDSAGECGGEEGKNSAVLLCASAPSGTPCHGDSGSGLTLPGSPPQLVGVMNTGTAPAGKECEAGRLNVFAAVAAPEIQDFIDGSESPPRAPRGGGASCTAPTAVVGSTVSCGAGVWSGEPTFTYAFIDDVTGQVLQTGPSPEYRLAPAAVGAGVFMQVEAVNGGGIGIDRTPPTTAIEPAPPAQTGPPAPAAGASLVDSNITVGRGGAATAKLRCVGSSRCRGTVRITVRYATRAKNGKGRATERTVTVATAGFAIAGGKVGTVKLTLDGVGRALLGGHAGRLGATLAILELAPGPAKRRAESVRLLAQRPRGGARGRTGRRAA
jgi:hypothetical protein